ncbi:MAG TPA: hypothetical protein DCL41_07005 [Bdellovibrionales bacterium]|nr:hypothetical protein [Pseudobdellovibrionaceae bacterium]HAG91602.1 hypothetical protein [Bdellovibrionales bacterium]|tara:strand:+ start:2285 stop:2803 length:519 start_codon:yes stop_codon:yes gene_type:complete
MNWIKSLAVAFAVMVSPLSHASFLIEPYLGYHFGTYDRGSADDTAKGPTFGGRLGFSNLGLQFGADYMGGNWELDRSPKFNGSASNLGVFVGYDFPILVRAYASYFFDAKLQDTTKYEGNLIRFGVGLSPVPLIDVNLEYITATYDKANGNSQSPNHKLSMFGVTVSVPLSL